MSDVQLFVWTCDLCGDRFEDTRNLFPTGWIRYTGFMTQIVKTDPVETHFKVDACPTCTGNTNVNGFMGAFFAWIKGLYRNG